MEQGSFKKRTIKVRAATHVCKFHYV